MGWIKSFALANRRMRERFDSRFPRFVAYPSYHDDLQERVAQTLKEGVDVVLEAGGVDRPQLSRGSGFRYVGLDIDDRPRCHEVYDEFICQSVEEEIPGKYDLILSAYLLEHVPDNGRSFKSMYDALEPGSWMHHYIPGANHPYSWVLRLVGPRLQKVLIRNLRPAAVGHTGYPTFFSYCTVAKVRKLCDRTGFSEVAIEPYYSAAQYFSFFLPFYVLIVFFENTCRKLGIDIFASGFVISARKPESARE